MGRKKGQTNMDAKWQSKLPEGWLEAAESMDPDELKKKLLEAESTIQSTEKDRDSDTKLKAIKDDLKALNGGYKDVLDCEKAKIKCIVSILQDRGAV